MNLCFITFLQQENISKALGLREIKGETNLRDELHTVRKSKIVSQNSIFRKSKKKIEFEFWAKINDLL